MATYFGSQPGTVYYTLDGELRQRHVPDLLCRGRRYPILVGSPAAHAGAAPGIAAGCLEDLSRAFGDGWDADRLMSAEAGNVAAEWQTAGPAWVLIGEAGPCIELAGSFPRGVVSKMLELAL